MNPRIATVLALIAGAVMTAVALVIAAPF